MKIVVDENSEGQRLDKFLAEILSDWSRSKIQDLIKENLIRVNSKNIKSSYVLKELDSIEFSENDAIKKLVPSPENIQLEIVWEDENMAVVNKPSGMLTHPTTVELENTLVNALLFHYGNNLSNLNGDMRPGIVHRLDRNTSGLLMIAKNNETHNYLVEEMKSRKFVKKYLAVVKGVIEEDNLLINTPIGRHLTQPHKQAVRADGKESLTQVKVLERYSDASLVELTLITGRTHQIRVHMSSIGHPVYNDTLYGFGKMRIKTEEQVLQSYKLEFTKPFTDERVNLEIPPDAKLTKVVNSLK